MTRLLAAVLVLTAAACATDEAPVGYGSDLGTPDNPVPRDDAYAVLTRMSFAAAQPQVDIALADLRGAAQDPGAKMIALAQKSGSPALTELDSQISVTLQNQLVGWIDAEIDKARIGSKTFRQFAADIAGIANTSLTTFTLESTLKITPTGAQHSLTRINFTPDSLDIYVPIGGLQADTLTQKPQATVAEAGALTVGDQHFGLGFGNHAWQAINLASTTLYGTDVQTALTSSVNCAAIAQTVSTKCVNGACVGHASQLRTICETSMAQLMGDLSTRVGAFNLPQLRFTQGAAHLIDDNLDGIGDRIADGTWSIETNLGFAVKATFTATAPR